MFEPVALAVEAEKDDSSTLPNTWESHVYQLSRDAALNLGFTVGSVKVTGFTGLLVLDSARVRTRRKQRVTERWGCGYRLIIEVSNVEATADLSFPGIAASVELKQAQASVSLEVKGYSGDDMWDVIPSPRPLDVDTYKTYLDAAANIQQIGDHPDKCVEVLLARDEAAFDILVGGLSNEDLGSAAVIVWALDVLSNGAPLVVALESFDGTEDETTLVEQTYRAIRQESFDSQEEPTDEERARARASLDRVRSN